MKRWRVQPYGKSVAWVVAQVVHSRTAYLVFEMTWTTQRHRYRLAGMHWRTWPWWEILKPLLPKPKGFGHPREVDLREIINAGTLRFFVPKISPNPDRASKTPRLEKNGWSPDIARKYNHWGKLVSVSSFEGILEWFSAKVPLAYYDYFFLAFTLILRAVK